MIWCVDILVEDSVLIHEHRLSYHHLSLWFISTVFDSFHCIIFILWLNLFPNIPFDSMYCFPNFIFRFSTPSEPLKSFSLCVCVFIYVCVFMYVCVCSCMCEYLCVTEAREQIRVLVHPPFLFNLFILWVWVFCLHVLCALLVCLMGCGSLEQGFYMVVSHRVGTENGTAPGSSPRVTSAV